jgi:hypothetical protein
MTAPPQDDRAWWSPDGPDSVILKEVIALAKHPEKSGGSIPGGEGSGLRIPHFLFLEPL